MYYILDIIHFILCYYSLINYNIIKLYAFYNIIRIPKFMKYFTKYNIVQSDFLRIFFFFKLLLSLLVLLGFSYLNIY